MQTAMIFNVRGLRRDAAEFVGGQTSPRGRLKARRGMYFQKYVSPASRRL
jgi:hypothetical protein